MTVAFRIACALVAGTLAATSTVASAQNPATARFWTDVSVGFGPARAGMRGDTIFEGSGNLFGSIGITRAKDRASSRPALQIEALAGRPFAAGDCIPGFTVCAPAFNFVGIGLNALTSVTHAAAPDAFTLGVGPGLYRVAPDGSHRVSPRLVGGLQAMATTAPIILGEHAGFMLGVRGIAFPSVHGQSAWVALLTSTVRAW